MNSLLIALNALKLAFSNKVGYIRYILIPIISVYCIMGMGKVGDTKFNAIVVNRDKSYISEAYIQELKENSDIQVLEVMDIEDDQAITERLVNGEVEIVIDIPENLRENIEGKKPAGIEIRALHGAQYAGMVKEKSNGIINKFIYISKGLKNNTKNEWIEEYERLQSQKITVKSKMVNFKGYIVEGSRLGFGVLILIMLNNAMGSIRRIKLEQWNGTYYRICTGPVTSIEYIFGMLIYSLALIMVQIIAALAIVVYARGDMLASSPISIGIILLAFGIAAVAMAMVVTLFFQNSGVMAITVVNITCMLSGCLFSVSYMPEFLKNLSYIFPQRWALMAIEGAQKGMAGLDIMRYVSVVMVIAAIMFSVCVIRMRKNKKIENALI